MYERMYALADGAYKGRTMYIIPYSMSIIGSPFAKYGFELTDSIYVVLNMHIMTRIGKAVCDALGDDEGFIKGPCTLQWQSSTRTTSTSSTSRRTIRSSR